MRAKAMAICALLGVSQSATIGAEPGSPLLTVRIMKSDGSVGLSDVAVRAQRCRKRSLDQEDTTDLRGYCRFSELPTGTYRLVFNKPGYHTEERIVRVSANESSILYVRLSTDATKASADSR